MERREFLRLASTGIVAISGIPFLSACDGIKRSDLMQDEKRPTMLNKELYEILKLASLAPSGHNTQPWFVKIIEPTHWIIGSNRKYWLPAVDPLKRETLLSIGAFIENLVVAANHFGFQTELRTLAISAEEEDLIDVVLHKDSPVKFDIEKIRKRRTVRKNYLQKEISTKDFNFVTDYNNINFHFIPAHSSHGKYLAEGTIEANKVQAFRQDAQEELSKWIRWSSKDALRYRDGLTSESMEITGISGWFVRNFYDRESVLAVDFRNKTIEEVEDQVTKSGGWIIISSSDSNVDTLVNTGRVFERMFVKIRERAIAIHPMTQLLEEEQSKNEVAKTLGLNSEIQFILRAGYLDDYPDPVSLRRPVSRFVRK